MSAPFEMGPLQLLTIYCANPACRKIFAIQVMGIAQSPLDLAGNGRVRLQ